MPDRDVLSYDEAAEFLGISEHSLRRAVETNGVPHRHVGSRILFRRAGLLQWLAEGEERHTDAPPVEPPVLPPMGPRRGHRTSGQGPSVMTPIPADLNASRGGHQR